MATRSQLAFIVAAILILGGSVKNAKSSRAVRNIHRRTAWEPEEEVGWAPMPMPSPPKIILLKDSSSNGGDNKKEDKLSMFLPIVMALGPLILSAIMMPMFMSLLSGLMSFLKSMMAMKMPMMPLMSMMPGMMPPTLPLSPLC